MKNEIVICSSVEVCSIDYDQRENRVISRGCENNYGPKVYVYDRKDHTRLCVECNRNLCNTDEAISQIKIVLQNNGLTDANGRRIANGNKQMISSLLMTFALIFIMFYYL
ncbi:unnamed protein product [Rotaria sp. Silwood2]|nr:unnamed protein product [Rotaria sp. Silwood2]CAF3188852.1 unnamed protein product [Rotaria sp. Silwood2]CAF3466307.1 unnamed protein product [Rotaria sp. Silwood2]CAF4271314.1 unnamed protein product [Rotaria sp. Silwood2]CAF4490928.1 unnamed protein product [Rotaria sp. Silwood2]